VSTFNTVSQAHRNSVMLGLSDTWNVRCNELALNLLTTTIVAPPSNASKWQMGFNLAFKGLGLFLK